MVFGLKKFLIDNIFSKGHKMPINNRLNINNDCQAAIQDNKIGNSVYFIENCKIIKSSKIAPFDVR